MKNDLTINGKTYKLFKKRDILSFLFFCGVVLSVFLFFLDSGTGDNIVILIDGRKTYEFDKSTQGVYPIEDDSGKLLMNLVISKDGVYIRDSACPLKLCEKHGNLSGGQDAIVCVPQKVIIRFSETGIISTESKYDIITQ